MKSFIFAFCILAPLAVKAGVPYPDSRLVYPGKIEIGKVSRRSQADAVALHVEAKKACFITHRALYALENFYEPIKKLFGDKGPNFPVLYKNRNFYEDNLRARYEACMGKGISLRFYGKCGTNRDTMAFVRTTFGYIHSTINICDEYFSQGKEQRIDTLVHEYGRLQDIGDSENFDTNNIYVWDAIATKTSGAFSDLEKMAAGK